jgi:hypothetical protein
MGKAVAERKSTEVSTDVIDFTQDQGVGVSDMSAKDVAIPFLVILQKGSPQIDIDHPDHAQYADLDAKTGQLYNTVTGEVYDQVDVVNCGFASALVEWKPRDSGGGFVGQHPDNPEVLRGATRNEKNQDVLPNGNIIVPTHYHYCLILDGDDVQQCVVSMTSTQLKKSRQWNSKIIAFKMEANGKLITPARFASRWSLATVAEKNDRGSWRGWKIDRIGLVEDAAIYAMAREFHNLIKKGLVQVTPPTGTDSVETAGGSEVPY